MAWATKCDRCGKYFDHHQDEANAFAFLSYDRPGDRYSVYDEEYDLCPECVHSMEIWFRGQRPTTQKEGADYDG